MSTMPALPPGQGWIDIIRRPSPEEFAAAFVAMPVLEGSVLPRPISGSAAIRAFFDATRAMYQTIAFTQETSAGGRTYLEWVGRFQSLDVAGVTVLTRDDAGLIESIGLYHRPHDLVIRFSAELSRRLAGQLPA